MARLFDSVLYMWRQRCVCGAQWGCGGLLLKPDTDPAVASGPCIGPTPLHTVLVLGSDTPHPRAHASMCLLMPALVHTAMPRLSATTQQA